MDIGSLVIAMMLFCIAITILNIVFLRRIHERARPDGQGWLRQRDVVLLAVFVLTLLVIVFGAP